ncbi:hypothetical protein B296_00002312, partial [Ensete ventricosum]
LPVGGSDADLEERIIQHLAAAAAMGRAHHIARREGRVRSGSHGRPQYLVFSTNSNTPSVGSVSASSAPREENELAPSIIAANSSATITTPGEEPAEETNVSPAHASQVPFLTSGSSSNPQRSSISSPRYKESIAKSTRGWRERLFSRNSTVADIGSEK